MAASNPSDRAHKKPDPRELSEADSTEESEESTDMESSNSTEEKSSESQSEPEEQEEKSFVANLYGFMKERNTPIERIPHLGFKQVNLWRIYKAVEKLGGYDSVTARRLWKNVYDELGGSPGSTSAATCTRRHYERLVLPFERRLRGEEDKPLPVAKPRKQYKSTKEGKGARAEGKRKRSSEEEKQLKTSDCDEVTGKQAGCTRCESGTCQHLPRGSIPAETRNKPENPNPDGTDAPEESGNRRPHDDWTANGLRASHSPHDHKGNGQSASICGSSRPIKSLLSNFHLEGSHGGVISPLVKKKLMAQASEAGSLHFFQTEGSKARARLQPSCSSPERPSVIHRAQQPELSPGLATSSRASDDGSPEPPSSPSLSACSTSEDCTSPPEDCTPDRPAYCASFTSIPCVNGIYKPLSHNPGKDLPSFPHPPRGFLEVNPYRNLAARNTGRDSREQPTDLSLPRSAWSPDSKGTENGIPSAKYSHQPPSSLASFGPKACWVPPMSSFTKVQPKTGEVVRPIFHPRPGPQAQGFKPHVPQKRMVEDPESSAAFGKKLRVVPPLPKDSGDLKGKGDLPKPFATHKLLHPPASLHHLSYLLPGYNRTRAPAGYPLEQLKPYSVLQPSLHPFVFPSLPAHLAAPPAASHPPEPLYRHLAVGGAPPFLSPYESAPHNSRIYPVHVWHPQASYAIAGLHSLYPTKH
ncbi:AT-rich interactive domain-containing protein 5A-like isoform X1 [Acipenser ruthenus]|uniref:AT-rich interactive domain-containing protein 5A-like isoform X1 n=1 Tax=Acipenser ruthenus TaxID=7906 RepID=UPI0027415EB7|nr:AT-rich interactive domain-containing protein 5A-like isoform X1 [Acipenser ruthenus]